MISKPLHILLWLATFPYHWTLLHFTVQPIERIVHNLKDGAGLHEAVARFLRGTLEELTLVKVGVCCCHRDIEKQKHKTLCNRVELYAEELSKTAGE